ncbi:DUF6285 domain-containing protein [Dongia rigui]|uniref:DUF6285 domain-containing protein n=1 Tax=Dongia rigui TaxID=940149 RepID=A0ABU5E484_9PROT|nr:DUF6285 domain-containing protein [Dongia rigui]MDY0874363.1 DUF6285 domain-containing protein [Dongia rigui]
MKQRPGAEALLDAALATLQEDLLPTLSGRQKFQAAMIARAISVAKQDMANAANSRHSELQSLSRLYGRDVGDDLTALRRQLAADIRARRFKPGTAEETRLIDHLVETTTTELRLTNTKYLAQRQRGRGAESAV